MVLNFFELGQLGNNIAQATLRVACLSNRLEIFKFLLSPTNITDKSYISHIQSSSFTNKILHVVAFSVCK